MLENLKWAEIEGSKNSFKTLHNHPDLTYSIFSLKLENLTDNTVNKDILEYVITFIYII